MAPLEHPAPGGTAPAAAPAAARRRWGRRPWRPALAAAVAGPLGLFCLRPGAARGALAPRAPGPSDCEPSAGQPPAAGLSGGLDEELLLLYQTSASVSVSQDPAADRTAAPAPAGDAARASAPVSQEEPAGNQTGAPAPGPPAGAAAPTASSASASQEPAVDQASGAREEAPPARQPRASWNGTRGPGVQGNSSASEVSSTAQASTAVPGQAAVAATVLPLPTDPAPTGEEMPTRQYLRAVRQELPEGSAAALRAELAADEQVFEEADVLADASAAAARGGAGAPGGARASAADSAWRLLPTLRLLQSEVEAAGIPAPLGLLAACVMAAAAASAATLVCGWGRRSDEGAALRRRVERVRMVSGDVVEKLFGLGADAPLFGGDAEAGSAGRGMLLRVRGRVVPGPDRTHLIAPISGRPCVMYSASVSPQSQDGVHPQPIARHSKGTDFAIELADAPHLRVRVSHQDAKLFCMVDGHLSSEHSFSEASDSRVDFILSHHSAQGMPGDGLMQAGAGLDGGLDGTLEFKESALLIGSTVSAVGELCREKDGSLQMHPWRPPVSTRAIFGKKAAAAPRDLLAGRVLTSDDPSLLDPAPGVLQRLFG